MKTEFTIVQSRLLTRWWMFPLPSVCPVNYMEQSYLISRHRLCCHRFNHPRIDECRVEPVYGVASSTLIKVRPASISVKLERFIVALTSIPGDACILILARVPADVDRYSICIENKYVGSSSGDRSDLCFDVTSGQKKQK